MQKPSSNYVAPAAPKLEGSVPCARRLQCSVHTGLPEFGAHIGCETCSRNLHEGPNQSSPYAGGRGCQCCLIHAETERNIPDQTEKTRNGLMDDRPKAEPLGLLGAQASIACQSFSLSFWISPLGSVRLSWGSGNPRVLVIS